MKRHIPYPVAAPDPRRGEDWRSQGACTEVDPEVMYPHSDPADIEAAKRVCARCPVARKCLRDVIRHEGGKDTYARHGVVAGLAPSERLAVYRLLEERGQVAG
ncbi:MULTISPECIES: WhiB family transcriptional regulator [unclassified Streptomyces]|uniref:WhiB family transcriptional regulator n=1 Tax=unclassified Streptomyces TaxID=2593676 RepID=UPI003BB70916